MQKFRTLAAFFLVEKQQPRKNEERGYMARSAVILREECGYMARSVVIWCNDFNGHFVRWRTHSARTNTLYGFPLELSVAIIHSF